MMNSSELSSLPSGSFIWVINSKLDVPPMATLASQVSKVVLDYSSSSSFAIRHLGFSKSSLYYIDGREGSQGNGYLPFSSELDALSFLKDNIVSV